jgi:hypothetical protein
MSALLLLSILVGTTTNLCIVQLTLHTANKLRCAEMFRSRMSPTIKLPAARDLARHSHLQSHTNIFLAMQNSHVHLDGCFLHENRPFEHAFHSSPLCKRWDSPSMRDTPTRLRRMTSLESEIRRDRLRAGVGGLWEQLSWPQLCFSIGKIKRSRGRARQNRKTWVERKWNDPEVLSLLIN